jgi:hypothetical protein
MYMSLCRTCLRWLDDPCFKQERQAPKGEGLKATHILRCVASTRKETRCRAHILTPRKMDTRNGGTRQRLSQEWE